MKIGLLSILFISAFSPFAFAETWLRAKVSKIVVDEVSGADCPVIRVANLDNPTWNIWLTMGSANSSKFVAIALSAISMGKEVEVRFQPTDAFGYGGQLKWISLAD